MTRAYKIDIICSAVFSCKKKDKKLFRRNFFQYHMKTEKTQRTVEILVRIKTSKEHREKYKQQNGFPVQC